MENKICQINEIKSKLHQLNPQFREAPFYVRNNF